MRRVPALALLLALTACEPAGPEPDPPQAAGRAMVARYKETGRTGSIVNISSLLGIRTNRNGADAQLVGIGMGLPLLHISDHHAGCPGGVQHGIGHTVVEHVEETG